MFENTVKDSSGTILTGKIWRKNHGFFKDLPFYSNIPRMEEMDVSLLGAIGQHGSETFGTKLLVVSKHKNQILT
jgi:hypothetical protein